MHCSYIPAAFDEVLALGCSIMGQSTHAGGVPTHVYQFLILIWENQPSLNGNGQHSIPQAVYTMEKAA